jgi:hypothetical protein
MFTYLKLSICVMTKIVHAFNEGLLSYCDKVYSRVNINQKHRIDGVMVSVLASSAVDRGFELRSGQTGENKLIINEMTMRSALFQTNTLSWIFIVLAH